MKNTLIYNGYHGTPKKHIDCILRDGFKETTKGFVGRGVYFFEDNKVLALDWAKTDKPGQKVYGVIRADIIINPDKLLDISDPNCLARQLITEKLSKYLSLMEQKGYIIEKKDRSFIEGKMIDDICQTKTYDLVRVYTVTHVNPFKKRGIYRTIPNSVELCVKNQEIIRNIRSENDED